MTEDRRFDVEAFLVIGEEGKYKWRKYTAQWGKDQKLYWNLPNRHIHSQIVDIEYINDSNQIVKASIRRELWGRPKL